LRKRLLFPLIALLGAAVAVLPALAAAGGRLEVQLLAPGSSLGGAAHAAPVQVGLLVRSPLRAGTATFSVALDARARRALRRHGHLALSVKITLNAAHSSSLRITRAVVVRG
jgi:hypothetical protein